MADEEFQLARALAEVIHLAKAMLERPGVDLNGHARLGHLRELHQLGGAEASQLLHLLRGKSRRRRGRGLVLRGALQVAYELREDEQSQLLVADDDHRNLPFPKHGSLTVSA